MQNESQRQPTDGLTAECLRFAAALMWPRWTEVRGCVLRDDVANGDAVAAWLDRPDGSVRQAEWALNHLHLYDLVVDDRAEADPRLDEALMEVANRIAAAWAASVHAAFPGRSFSVTVGSPEDDYGPTVYLFSEPNPRGSD